MEKIMLEIKVLGSGCPNCKRLEAETRAVLEELGIEFELTKVTDDADITAYGVLHTPALVVNETVVSAGRIPRRSQIKEWLQKAS
jgi:small redox-active disulfide protein 2